MKAQTPYSKEIGLRLEENLSTLQLGTYVFNYEIIQQHAKSGNKVQFLI